MISGEGAGKGDTYRPVNREVFNRNFEDIDWRRKGTTPLHWTQCPQCDYSTFRRICPRCKTPIK